MKKTILILSFFFLALPLFAKEPLVKFYLNDGSTKQFNIADIDTIGLIKSKSNYVIKIFYSDTLIAYYPTEVITKIQFEYDSLKNQVLNVYICGYPKTYSLFFIDSIYFYTDIYQPLTIGTQVWMLKNLNVDHYRNGDSIPEIRDTLQWYELITGAWCYFANSDSLGKIYGKLYNWYNVVDPRGLAPKGWHVPSLEEWTKLSIYLGGDFIAGGILKEADTNHWSSPNGGATNESGFSALPGGSRSGINGTYIDIGLGNFSWSVSEYTYNSYNYGVYRYLSYNHSGLLKDYCYKKYGFSVRCIKDK